MMQSTSTLLYLCILKLFVFAFEKYFYLFIFN